MTLVAPILSIVVGTYNRLSQIRDCLASIEADVRTPHVVYVADGGSTDGTVEYLQSVASSRIRPILAGRRMGQARAYNEVFEQVDTPYVCWISDDNVLVGGGTDAAVAALEQQADLGMVGLKVRDMEGPFTAAPYIGGVSSLGILNINQGLLRTPVLKAVGGFSEAFRDYGIDPDLTAKVLLSGWSVAMTKAVAIHHYRNWSTDKTSPEFVKIKQLQAQYQRRYDDKYADLKAGLGAAPGKALIYRLIRRLAGARMEMNSHVPVAAGLLPRDIHNILTGRFISVLDPILSLGRGHHLIQRCPARLRPRQLPADPPAYAGELVHTR